MQTLLKSTYPPIPYYGIAKYYLYFNGSVLKIDQELLGILVKIGIVRECVSMPKCAVISAHLDIHIHFPP